MDTFDCSILNALDMHRKARIDVNRKCLGFKILHNLQSESVGKSIKKRDLPDSELYNRTNSKLLKRTFC